MTAEAKRMESLALANEARLARSRLRHEVHDVKDFARSCLELARVLDDSPAYISSLRAEQALKWVWRMSWERARDILENADCSPYKRVGDLSTRQRRLIVESLMLAADERDAA